VKNAGKIYVRDDVNNRLFRVGRAIKSPSYFIAFSLTDSWPYVIRNNSSFTVSFRQKNVDLTRTCAPKSQTNYSWDQPSFSDKYLLMKIENKEYIVDVLEIGKKSQFKVKKECGDSFYVSLEVKAQGPAVVILFKDYQSASTTAMEADQSEVEETNDDASSGTCYIEVLQSVVLAKLPYIALSLVGHDLKVQLIVFVYIYIFHQHL